MNRAEIEQIVIKEIGMLPLNMVEDMLHDHACS